MTPDEVRDIRDRDKRTVGGGTIRKLAESWLRLWEDVARLEREMKALAIVAVTLKSGDGKTNAE